MKKSIALIGLACILAPVFSGCKKESNGPNDVRIQNISVFSYTEVFVDTSKGQNDYGTIPAGGMSEYKRFPFAFNEAYIQLKINGVLHKTDTVNFTALTPLVGGKVTYSVSADTVTRKLVMEVTELLPF